MVAPPPSRRALAALAVVGAGAIALVACSGDESPAADSTTTVTAVEPALPFTAHSNPAVPVTVPVGRRFAIVLPADPAHGWRWVVQPVDTRYLLPLGSEFRDDPAALEQATQATSTTTAPPEAAPTTTTLAGASRSTTTTEVPTTSTEAPTATTAPGPLVQVISFAGRAEGTTTVTVRYERIGSTDQEPAPAQRAVFTVVVGTAAPPSGQAGPSPG